MTDCKHYEGSGVKKRFKISDQLICKLCDKQLTKGDIKKLKEGIGNAM